MRLFQKIFMVAVIGLSATFGITNLDPIEINLWPLSITVKTTLGIAILSSIALGMVMGLIYAGVAQSSKFWKLKKKLGPSFLQER
ncbi:MAG: hypothetical protein VW226_05910 [Rhodospirillaceae bacterium]